MITRRELVSRQTAAGRKTGREHEGGQSARKHRATVLQMGLESQPIEQMDALQPFHRTELIRPM